MVRFSHVLCLFYLSFYWRELLDRQAVYEIVREGMALGGDGFLYFVAAIVPNQVPPGIRDVTRRALL